VRRPRSALADLDDDDQDGTADTADALVNGEQDANDLALVRVELVLAALRRQGWWPSAHVEIAARNGLVLPTCSSRGLAPEGPHSKRGRGVARIL